MGQRHKQRKGEESLGGSSPFRIGTINATTGKVTIAKGTPVGKYPVTVRVNDAGSSSYESGSATASFTVKIVKAASTLKVKTAVKLKLKVS